MFRTYASTPALVALAATLCGCLIAPDPAEELSTDGAVDGGLDDLGTDDATSAGDESGEFEDDTGGANDGGEESGGPVQSSLPCEIQELLQSRCVSCHGATPVGAPMSLVALEDLTASSFSDPGLSFAEQALVRMTAPDNPMPPAPATAVAPEEVTAFADWVDAGMPAGTCDDEPPPDPFDVPPTCSTGRWWDDGDDGSPLMFPGRACLTCHALEAPEDDDVPNLLVGGTVFETAHEPDDCKGPAGELDGEPVYVEVTSDDGQTVSLPVNASGNFLMHASATPFPPPYLVKVVHGDAERAMPIPAPSGDCNACHTQQGVQGAPGRIVLP